MPPKTTNTNRKKAPKNRGRPQYNAARHHGSPACGYHNHEGCSRGGGCRYRHIADAESIPDSRNKNVCYHFIMGNCKFTDGKCWYSHNLAFLDPSKNKVKALAKRRTATGKDTDVDEVLSKLQALKAAGADKWESDGTFNRVTRELSIAERMLALTLLDLELDDSDDSDDAFGYGSDDDGYLGFPGSDVEALMEQGIKPWDAEASAALAVLNGYY